MVSTGRDSNPPADMGWEFLAKRIGKKTSDQEIAKSPTAKAWSNGVLPGRASGIADVAKNSGAQAMGLRRGQARGLSLCLHHPKFPTLGVVLTHPSGGGSSPVRNSGGIVSPSPHQPGSPRSQYRSWRASMCLRGGEGYCSLRYFPGS